MPVHSRIIETGGQAAREVYDTLDTRERIFSLLRRRELVAMLRLEKAATESVARVLFRTVNVDQVDVMSRDDPRRAAYCDAVRTLDLSPRPYIHTKTWWHMRGRPGSPSFPLKGLPQRVVVWRTLFPNLRTVLYEYPLRLTDDAYSARIEGERLLVDLESHIDLMGRQESKPIPYPHCPSHKGMEIGRHTIAISLVQKSGDEIMEQYGEENYSDSEEDAEWEEEQEQIWNDWKPHLYEDSSLDRRVTSITFSGKEAQTKVGIAEVKAFVERRRRDKCEPLRSFHFPRAVGVTLDQVRDIAISVGPDLRILYFPAINARDIAGWHEIFNVLDQAFRQLEMLTITGPGLKCGLGTMKLSVLPRGMPHLRELAWEQNRGKSMPYFTDLGSDDCVFRCSSLVAWSQHLGNSLIKG